MLREGMPSGVISVARARAEPSRRSTSSWSRRLPTRRSSPSKTSACSTELKESAHRDDTDGHGRHPACDSSSPTDVQPVFDAIVQNAARLCEGTRRAVSVRGRAVHLVAQHIFTPEGLEGVRGTFPARPTRALGRAGDPQPRGDPHPRRRGRSRVRTPRASRSSTFEAASGCRCCARELPSASSQCRVPSRGRSPRPRSSS